MYDRKPLTSVCVCVCAYVCVTSNYHSLCLSLHNVHTLALSNSIYCALMCVSTCRSLPQSLHRLQGECVVCLLAYMATGDNQCCVPDMCLCVCRALSVYNGECLYVVKPVMKYNRRLAMWCFLTCLHNMRDYGNCQSPDISQPF